MRLERTVIWAVDPFEPGVSPPVREVRELAETVRRAGLELLPAHVVGITERQWETGDLPLVPEIQVALDRYLARFSLGDGVRARVIVDETGTRAGAVRALLDLAARERAEWVTVSSHGRSGVKRLVLGSFAEMLLEHGPLPVLFLPHQELHSQARAARVALFPTDLTPAAHAAFTRFLSVASRQRLEIVILHSLSYPVPSMEFGMGALGFGPVLPETYVADQVEWAKALGGRLVEEARHAGVKARFVLDTALVPAITGRALLAAARREHARMIAMPSFSGPVARFMAMSVGQEVFRSGRTLVWLCGPKALGEDAAKAA